MKEVLSIRSTRVPFSLLLATICVGVVAAAQSSAQGDAQGVAIRVVDDSIGNGSLQGPRDADRLPVRWARGALWLKREGQIAGNAIAEAHVDAGPGGEPAIEFTWTEQGEQQFAALTRVNVGRRIAVVVDGVVFAPPATICPPLRRAANRPQTEDIVPAVDCDARMRLKQAGTPPIVVHDETAAAKWMIAGPFTQAQATELAAAMMIAQRP